MRFKIILHSAPDDCSLPETEWSFDRHDVSIGRGKQCQIKLADPRRLVSSHHATIFQKSDELTVMDHSANGTQLNDQWLEKNKEAVFQLGDVLDCCGFRLQVHPIALDDTEEVSPEEYEQKTVALTTINRFDYAVETLQLQYWDVMYDEESVRQGVLLGTLRKEIEQMAVQDALRFLRYVEAAFPDAEFQCRQIMELELTDM
ncbi:MAG: hypothetical protein NPIRA04_04660 [Nitrospirales bacterium]|nr:MAG: hypothetical protein NPIRA04_04660 [Nitrospirales bacterium]